MNGLTDSKLPESPSNMEAENLSGDLKMAAGGGKPSECESAVQTPPTGFHVSAAASVEFIHRFFSG